MENNVIQLRFRKTQSGLAEPAAKPQTAAAPEVSFRVTLSTTQQDLAQQPVKKDFRSLAEQNLSNQERLRKERAQANKAVLKSYRIK